MSERFIEGVPAPAYPHQAEPPNNYSPSPFEPDSIDVVPPVVLAPAEMYPEPPKISMPLFLEKEIMPLSKNKKSGKRHHSLGLKIGGVIACLTVIGGGFTQIVISGLQENGAAEKLPALAQADGFAGAVRSGDVHVPEGYLTTFVPTIDLKVNDNCTLASVRFVARDAGGKISWGGDIVDLDNYTIISYPKNGTSKLVETFHNMQDFTAEGFAEKYCS